MVPLVATRRVERLCLTADADEGIARGRLLVEDALRIASFPTVGARQVLLIRRLEIGAVNPDASSAAVAPAIEEAVRAAAVHAVRIDDPEAARAEAVVVPDIASSAATFVVRLTAGPPPVEWYWGHVFPGWQGGVGPERGVRLAVDRLLGEPGGAVHLVRLTEALVSRGRVDALLSCLSSADGQVLEGSLGTAGAAPALRASDVDAGSEADPPESPLDVAHLPALGAWLPVLSKWAPRWGRHDPRSRWLAAAALVSAQPVVAGTSVLSWMRERVLETVLPSRRPVRHPPGVRHGRGLRPVAARPDEPVPRGFVEPPPVEPGERPVVVTRTHGHEAMVAARPLRGDARVATGTETAAVDEPSLDLPSAPWEGELQATRVAGFAFLVPVLARLGLAEALRRNPALVIADFPVRLLRRLADRLRVSRGDPMRRWLAPPAGAPVPEHLVYDGDLPLDAWIIQARRLVRRLTGRGLRWLVARPGHVATTRTHVDIVLPLADLDLRVRRAGLDVDPGWVPWIGRVFSFHYVEG